MATNEEDDQRLLMAAETIAGDLASMLVQELRLLPDIWPKIGEEEQGEILDRVRKRVLDSVREAVRLIAAAERTTVGCQLKKVSFSDKAEAVFSLAKHDPAAMDLAHAQGLSCLIVVMDPGQFLGGVDDVKPDADQPDLPGLDGNGSAAQIIEQANRRSKRKPPDKGAPPATG